MSQDIKIWEIIEKQELKEIQKSRLDLEKRIEDWIEKDISIISNDFLIVGRQVSTDFGGSIDILCLNYDGDTIIIELKRDKTPREITAQLLDYASWVKNLSNERITDIANDYLKKQGPLERAFKEKFNKELPEILNESHKMLVVASETDDSSERIIEYLSDDYGIAINAVTFQYFQQKEKEFLARVFLIEPSKAEYRTQTRTASKRNPALSYEELEEVAENNGVSDIYRKLVDELTKYFNYRITTRSSVGFIGVMGKEKSRTTIFSLLPGESDPGKGLYFKVYTDEFADYFNITKNKLKSILPPYNVTHIEDRRERGEGYFKNKKQSIQLLLKLEKIKDK